MFLGIRGGFRVPDFISFDEDGIMALNPSDDDEGKYEMEIILVDLSLFPLSNTYHFDITVLIREEANNTHD